MRIRKTGCYTNITNAEYHGDKDYISRSALMDFDISPHTYWAKHLNPDRPIVEPTSAMILGTAFHALILEPDLFKEQYICLPEKVLLRDVGRELYDEYKRIEREAQDSENKVVLSWNDYQNLLAMQDAFNRNGNAKELIKGAIYESSYFWQDKESQVMLKARPDVLQPNIIVDLKTATDASPRAFQNEMVRGGYHIQMAMIRDAVQAIEGRTIENFYNIVIETKYPYNIGIYQIDDYAIEAGRMKYKQLCVDLKQAQKDNCYPDYGIQLIGLPKWAI